MSTTTKHILVYAAIFAAAFIVGRLSVRAVLNLMLGGTLFGGNIL